MTADPTPATIDMRIVLAVLRGLREVSAGAPSAIQALRFILGHGAGVDADLIAAIAKHANVHLVRITAPQSVIASASDTLPAPPDHLG